MQLSHDVVQRPVHDSAHHLGHQVILEVHVGETIPQVDQLLLFLLLIVIPLLLQHRESLTFLTVGRALELRLWRTGTLS